MIVLKIALILVFMFAWLRSRSSLQAEPSDFFYLSFLLIYVPGFLFNPSGETALNRLHLSHEAARVAEFGMLIMLGLGALVLTLRRYAERKCSWLTINENTVVTPTLAVNVAIVGAALSIGAVILLLAIPEFREFKRDVLKFFTFQFEGSDYRVLRNGKYADGWLTESLLGRARFTIFPILFCLVIYPLLSKRRMVVAIVVGIAIFVALPASLSKLPIFFFLGYGAILCATRHPRFLDIRFLSAMLAIGTVMIVTVLILLYTAQYQSSVVNGTVLPLNLAIERIWGETYSVVVRYFNVYPSILPYTGISGINMLAKLIGVAPRLPDIEVAQTLLGSDSGSNPGVFFLGGYAAFGMAGLCLFAVLGSLVLWLLDIVGRKMRSAPLRATYLAVVGMNAVFLNQIALQTALVTYGLVVVPVVLICLDRLVVLISKRVGTRIVTLQKK